MSDTTAPGLAPATPTRLGSNAGQPLSRRDGVLKVTGAATYAADNLPDGCLHAVTATAPVARGRLVGLDVEAARAHPGVVAVWTHENRPPLADDPDSTPFPFAFKIDALQNDRVRYAGQPVALVVAETLEAATEAARLLNPQVEAEAPRLGHAGGEAYEPQSVGVGAPPTHVVGDAEAALAAAERTFEGTWDTPDQYHNAMEPHAMVARWDGDALTLDVPNQAPVMARAMFARFFGIAPDRILIRTPFLGGGFGSKAIPTGPYVLAILAARELGRPVKYVFRREQMYGPTGHRGATRQTLKMGMDAQGRLSALLHHADSFTSSFDEFLEPAANVSKNLYAAPNLKVTHRGVRVDKGTPMAMRAPGEASGSAALECAVDEAAYALGLDPLEFRLRNYAEVDPATGLPFSSKALRECYAQAAEAFGWAGRPLEPRSMTDAQGRRLGWGMGTAQFPATFFAAQARATLRADGTALVETSGVDMGQGAWTALAQIAADGLGLDIDQVEFHSGASNLPDAGIAGGSGHTATAGSALHAAGSDAIGRLTELATNDPESPLFGAGNSGVVARDGRLHRRDDESRSESYAEILARAGQEVVVGEGSSSRPESEGQAHAFFSHGAILAETAVDPELGQVRVTRMVGAFAAGRIINPKLARSQLEGGMIWGLSFALHEEAVHDPVTGRIANADLAGYHVPVHADIPELKVLTVHEDDAFVNALGVKGVGELAISGAVGAIANAVWHATGKRPRRFPIRLETLID
ncbi:xanthine dehydrogenase family protein molybdopterin-binding subunit [Albimonas sp. CAU 1670]|uniref:xanthine dehydrogenase family protein molybdopterin-binding subunit n=1 Tax=Albimonas sp. CAU 1670 TaxID=3032599 RepID=UPI0023DAF5E0|nr:xanthine dehydrogenase family protein molybdopterin-binding subunit [Albimonas sp. CAU 1670]MDF2233752.1 xanthine dehydrogenase family protein molybdopterin-binding subunit [Albimonas sp. CAU 1670]